MALWRCPHCGTPQPVAARCWVCRRSATSCGTCRHFRASVAARIGYCGLDREREPLAGNEIRACWVGVAAAAEDGETPVPTPLIELAPPRLAYGFVPVDTLLAASPDAPQSVAAPPPTIVPSPAPAADGMLWTDLEG